MKDIAGDKLEINDKSLLLQIESFDILDACGEDSFQIYNWMIENIDSGNEKISLLYKYIKFFYYNKKIPLSNMFIALCMRELINVITRKYNFLDKTMDQQNIYKKIKEVFDDSFKNNKYKEFINNNDLKFSLSKNLPVDTEVIVGSLGFSEKTKFKMFLSNYIQDNSSDFKNHVDSLADMLSSVKKDLDKDVHFGNSKINYSEKVNQLDSIFIKCIDNDTYQSLKSNVDHIIRLDNPNNYPIEQELLEKLLDEAKLLYRLFSSLKNKDWLPKFKHKKLFSNLSLTKGTSLVYLLNQLEDNNRQSLNEVINLLKNTSNEYNEVSSVIKRVANVNILGKDFYKKIFDTLACNDTINKKECMLVDKEELNNISRHLISEEYYDIFETFNRYLLTIKESEEGVGYSVLSEYTYKEYADKILLLDNLDAYKIIFNILMESSLYEKDDFLLRDIDNYDENYYNNINELLPVFLYKISDKIVTKEGYDYIWEKLNKNNSTFLKVKSLLIAKHYNRIYAEYFIKDKSLFEFYFSNSYSNRIIFKAINSIFGKIEDKDKLQYLKLIESYYISNNREDHFEEILVSVKEYMPKDYSHKLLKEDLPNFTEDYHSNRVRSGFVNIRSPISAKELEDKSPVDIVNMINNYEKIFGKSVDEYLINSFERVSIEGLLKEFKEYIKENPRFVIDNLNDISKIKEKDFISEVASSISNTILSLNNEEKCKALSYILDKHSEIDLGKVISLINLISNEDNILKIDANSIDMLFKLLFENIQRCSNSTHYVPKHSKNKSDFDELVSSFYNDCHIQLIESYIVYNLSLRRNKVSLEHNKLISKLEELLNNYEGYYLFAKYLRNLQYLNDEWTENTLQRITDNKTLNINEYYVFILTYSRYVNMIGDQGIYKIIAEELYSVISNLDVTLSISFDEEDFQRSLGNVVTLMPSVISDLSYEYIGSKEYLVNGVVERLKTNLERKATGKNSNFNKAILKRFVNNFKFEILKDHQINFLMMFITKCYYLDTSLKHDNWALKKVVKLINRLPGQWYSISDFLTEVNDNLSEKSIKDILEIYFLIMNAYRAGVGRTSIYSIDSEILSFIKLNTKVKNFIGENKEMKDKFNRIVENYIHYLDSQDRETKSVLACKI